MTGSARSPSGKKALPLSLRSLDAVLFDLDGVLTDTASLHEAAWTETFNELFDLVGESSGKDRTPKPFTGDDYRRLVDGKARLDGVRNVLADRKLNLAQGDRSEGPGLSSVWGIAAKKDSRFSSLLKENGPRVYPGVREILELLRTEGVSVAVVSASRHCKAVLAQAGLGLLADVVIDGQVAEAMQLPSKPDPAPYLEAAKRLGAEPRRTAIVEDAIAGVASGKAGAFAEVIGIDHHHQPEVLFSAGATMVLENLSDLMLLGPGPLRDGWHLVLDPSKDDAESESLAILANGYMGSLRTATWTSPLEKGMFSAFVLRPSKKGEDAKRERKISAEEMTEIPDWLALTFSCGGPLAGDATTTVENTETKVDLRSALLLRRCHIRDSEGRRSSLVERRIISMADPHLGALSLEIVAENWSGPAKLRSGINAERFGKTNKEMSVAEPYGTRESFGEAGPDMVWLAVRLKSKVLVSEAVRTRLTPEPQSRVVSSGKDAISYDMTVEMAEGSRLHVEKVAAVFSSGDLGISDPVAAAQKAASEAGDFDKLLAAHQREWERLWSAAGSHTGPKPLAENLPVFQALQRAQQPH